MNNVIKGSHSYEVFSFIETELAPGHFYNGIYTPPRVVGWNNGAVFSLDLNENGFQDVILPMVRGYASGIDTRTPFLVFENKSGVLNHNSTFNNQMPNTSGARKAEPIFLDNINRLAYVTIAHDHYPDPLDEHPYLVGFSEMIIISQEIDGIIRPDLLPILPDSTSFNSSAYVNAHSLAVGDLNGDGLDDILVGHWGPHGTYALYQNIDGSFSVADNDIFRVLTDWRSHNPLDQNGDFFLLDIHIADVTGNGFGDIIAGWGGNGNSHSYVFINDNGNFSVDNKIALPDSIYGSDNQGQHKTFSYDFNGNGHLDLMILWVRDEPYYGGNYIQFLTNDGHGNFTDSTEIAFRNPYEQAFLDMLSWSDFWQILDVNGNGHMDLVGSSANPRGEASANVFINNGSGRFIDFQIKTDRPDQNTWAEIIHYGDFNGDGILDYLTFESMWGDNQGQTSINTFNVYSTNHEFELSGRYSFNDVILAFDIEGPSSAGAVYRLYQAALGRTPDKEGLGYWIDAMDKGLNLTSMSHYFIQSPEFRSNYGEAIDDAEFVTLLYNNILGRNPEKAGFDYWSDVLSKGHDRSEIVPGFSESIENQLRVIGDIQYGIEYLMWQS